MSQCAVQIVEFGCYGQIVIVDTTRQLFDWFAEDTENDFLQTGREAVDVCTLVEIVQDAVELAS